MIGRMRAAAAALVGALCGAGWFLSLEPAALVLCPDSGLQCATEFMLPAVPVLVLIWALAGWGLLRLARFSPAWPAAVVGMAGAVVLLVITSFSLRFAQVQLPEGSGVLLVAITAAGGYALAAVVTAGYGGRRDRTEHHGQDG